MQWTTETPTEPGVYWVRESPMCVSEIREIFQLGDDVLDTETPPEEMHVRKMGEHQSAALTEYAPCPVLHRQYEWYGPITPPL